MTEAVGIDVGGTKIAGAVVDLSTGRMRDRMQVPTGADDGGEAVLARVEAMARTLLDRGGTALGVGVAELVSPAGAVFSGHRIAWAGMPVQARLARLAPARVESDVRAAALAEVRFGAGRGHADVLFVTVGTGISAVSVRGGVPYAGARGAALVIANGPVACTCPACGTRSTHILEDTASGPGLVAAYRAAGGQADRAEDVLAAGTDTARRIVDAAAARLGGTLALLTGALDPAMVIMGGGLGSAPGAYFDGVRAAWAAGLWQDDAAPEFVRAALGPDAGIVGAALAAAGETERQRHHQREETT